MYMFVPYALCLSLFMIFIIECFCFKLKLHGFYCEVSNMTYFLLLKYSGMDNWVSDASI